MIGKFLDRIGLGPMRPPRSSGDRPTVHSQRRLAIEPIEDRLLLSAASADTASEGGMVVLDSFYSDLGPYCGALHADRTPVSFVVAGERNEPAVVPSTDSLDVQGSLDQVSAPLGPTDSPPIRNEQAAPTPKEVTPDDLIPAPPDSGMVDVTHVAHDTVTAESGPKHKKSDDNDLPGLPPPLQLATNDPLPNKAAVGAAPSRPAIESLTGSRGRLTAFDLAMQQETDWRTSLEDPGLDGPTDDMLPTATRTGSPQLAPVVPAAFSNHEPIPLDNRLESSASTGGSSETSLAASTILARSRVADPLDVAPNSAAPPTTLDSDAKDAASVSVVVLDQRRKEALTHMAAAIGIGQAAMSGTPQSAQTPEKPGAHLAIALAMGQATLGRRRQSTRDPEREQGRRTKGIYQFDPPNV